MSDPAALAPRLHWMNCDPLPLERFSGHPLLVCFWSLSSGTSQNLLQWFLQTAHRHRGKAGFLAIHVPKFEFERDGQLAARWLASLGNGVPLANDPDWVAWQHFHVEAWPTTLLLDADGRVCRTLVGDRGVEAMADALDSLVDASFLRASGVVHAPPLRAVDGGRQLYLPMGLAATATRLYIADTGHHRILECGHDGRILRRFGSGKPDFLDGSEREAAFRSPRGLVATADRLYVADSGNHAVRSVDLRIGTVDTLLGQGRPDDPRPGLVAGPKSAPLDRPVGLALAANTLYIALAGCHQIWSYTLSDRQFAPVAGSGEFGLADGRASAAQFANPGALVAQGDHLWVLDAGNSALRQVNPADGLVNTWFGRGPYEFGLRDGSRKQALMQCPMGMALDPEPGALWIADSGNAALRLFATPSHTLATATFDHAWQLPVAVACSPGALWVLDAGADAIVRVDPQSRQSWTLDLRE